MYGSEYDDMVVGLKRSGTEAGWNGFSKRCDFDGCIVRLLGD